MSANVASPWAGLGARASSAPTELDDPDAFDRPSVKRVVPAADAPPLASVTSKAKVQTTAQAAKKPAVGGTQRAVAQALADADSELSKADLAKVTQINSVAMANAIYNLKSRGALVVTPQGMCRLTGAGSKWLAASAPALAEKARKPKPQAAAPVKQPSKPRTKPSAPPAAPIAAVTRTTPHATNPILPPSLLQPARDGSADFKSALGFMRYANGMSIVKDGKSLFLTSRELASLLALSNA